MNPTSFQVDVKMKISILPAHLGNLGKLEALSLKHLSRFLWIVSWWEDAVLYTARVNLIFYAKGWGCEESMVKVKFIPQQYSPNLVLSPRHFTEDCYSNSVSQRLKLYVWRAFPIGYTGSHLWLCVFAV